MIKPIIGRIGGKWRLSKWIIEHIKRFDWSLYVEPFCGSAAVYFQLLNEGLPELIKSRGHHPRFVLNDLDSKIINLYRVCRDYPELLAYATYFTPYSREEHKLSQKGEAIDDLIELCRQFLIRDKQSYSRNGERINLKGDYNCPFATTMDKNNSQELTFANTSDRILTASEHLGERFNELKEGIKTIQDETLRQQSEQALDAILNQLQQTLETDLRVEFVRKFLVYDYQERKGRHFNDPEHSYWAIEQNGSDRQPQKSLNIPDKILLSSPHLQGITELKKVYLENDDFEKVCRRWDTGHTLHYIDAPYYGKEKYYEKEFTTECHSRLCQMAHEMEGQVIISYYPHPDILKRYSENEWEFHYKETTASSAGITRHSKNKTRPKRTELLLVKKSKQENNKVIDLKNQLSLF